MYIEEDYVKKQFVNNFLEKGYESIVIYGTGLNTQRLLENVNDSRIVGLMDEKRTGEILWGYKVLSYQEVSQIKDCSIVIIARNAVINVIYRRIEKFCQENNINVYDIHGENLRENLENRKEHKCFFQDEKKLRKEIRKYEVISFDIFDTLLMRRVMRPRDIYYVIDTLTKEKNYLFSKERIEAEDTFLPGSNPNIEMIYDEFQKNTGISLEEKRALIELEISTEKKFLVRREKIFEIYRWALKNGKTVFLISDMYFPKSVLEEILQHFGIVGYKDILISCEFGKGKCEGLFDEYKKILKKNGKGVNNCLHIGDNYYADILAAETIGISTYQIYSAQEMFERSIYAQSLQYCNSLEENLVLAHFVEIAYNNPFRECHANGKLIIKSTEELIGLFVAPIICKYMIWLVQNVQKNDNDLLVFPSRDGYLLKIIYEKIKNRQPELNLPEAIYIYTSRRSAMVAAVEKEKDVFDIVNFTFTKDTGTLFKDRFDITLPESMRNRCVDQILAYWMDSILKNCKEEGKNYKEYLKTFKLGKYSKIALMDFVAMGTVQDALEKIIGQKLEGYYFLHRKGNQHRLAEIKCHSLYKEAGDFQISANIYRFYYFLETIITSYEPCFWGVDTHGEKKFYQEKRKKETIKMLKMIHKVILDYCDRLLQLLPDIKLATSPVDLYDNLLGFFSCDFSELKCDEIMQLINIDEFMCKNVTEFNR